MEIATQQLIAAGANCDGLTLFREQFGEALELPDGWTEAHQYMMLASPEWRRHWGWAVHERIIPAWSMAGANLLGADLTGANLTRADLAGADLYGADLRGASLTRADLTCADLTWANLRGANLTGADLAGAVTTGAIRL